MRMTREFYVPTLFKEKIEVPDTTIVIYVITDTSAKGFRGKKAKPDFYYEFKTPERMAQYIEGYIEGYKEAQEYKAQKKAKKKEAIASSAKAIAPGDIFYTSWGYDQTNVEFYKVLSIKGQKVTLVEVAQKVAEAEMTYENVLPVADAEISKPFTRMVGEYGFKINSFAYASKWDGKPKHQTAFGYGH